MIWGDSREFSRSIAAWDSPSRPRSGFDQEQSETTQFAFGDLHSLTPTTVNEINVGLCASGVSVTRLTLQSAIGSRTWYQRLSPIPLTWGAPSMTPAGYSEIGYSSNNACSMGDDRFPDRRVTFSLFAECTRFKAA